MGTTCKPHAEVTFLGLKPETSYCKATVLTTEPPCYSITHDTTDPKLTQTILPPLSCSLDIEKILLPIKWRTGVFTTCGEAEVEDEAWPDEWELPLACRAAAA